MFLLLAILFTCYASSLLVQAKNEYIIVGVSGGLQFGFPDHSKMDYHSGQPDGVEAIFLGRALVRGYKAYLDVMQPDWRQYTPEPYQPLINCNVIPSGCYHHANEYWMYLVDTRQFISILMNEPRFLSIAPDLGLVDLQAEETAPLVKHIALHQIQRQNKTDTNVAAFPIVTGAWYNPSSHIPSPVLYEKLDGTQVTNFPQSLAKWVGYETDMQQCQADRESIFGDGAPQAFWDKVRHSIRHAEVHPPPETGARAIGPPFDCQKKARFGVTPHQARINYAFRVEELDDMIQEGGFRINFRQATVSRK